MRTRSLIFIVVGLIHYCYGNLPTIESLFSGEGIKEGGRAAREAPFSLDSLPPFVVELYSSFSYSSTNNEYVGKSLNDQNVQFIPIETFRGKFKLDFTKISSDPTVTGVDLVISANMNHNYYLRNGISEIAGEHRGGSVIFDLGDMYKKFHGNNGIAWFEISTFTNTPEFSSRDSSAAGVVRPLLVVYRNVDKHVFDDGLMKRQKRNTDHLLGRQNTNVAGCHLIPWIVDFTLLGWDNYIVAPDVYNAGRCVDRCEGRCLTQVRSPERNATNYAIIKNQYKIRGLLNNNDDPCCTPTAYAPISMLYLEEDGTVVLKKMLNMRVTSCGCR